MANFLHLFRDSGGAVYSWATDVARVCWKRDQTSLKISNIRSTSTTDVSNNASNEIELWDGLLEITGYSAQLTVQRRPNIPKISSFSYGLRHEDGLLTLSGLVPDIISRILIQEASAGRTSHPRAQGLSSQIAFVRFQFRTTSRRSHSHPQISNFIHFITTFLFFLCRNPGSPHN